MKIIDGHRHIGLCGARGNPSAAGIVAQLDALGIDHAILAPGEGPRDYDVKYEAEVAAIANLYETVAGYLRTGDQTPEIATLQSGVPYHDEVLNAVRTTGGRLLGCWFLNPHLGESEFDRARSAVLNEGLKYTKLHPPGHAFAADDADLLAPVMDLARGLGVPVWFHTSSGPGTEVPRLAALAGSFPDVNVVMGHAFVQENLPEKENVPVVLAAANGHENLWVDLSHARPDSIAAIFELGPQDRLMFGTDDPWEIERTPEQMLEDIRSAAGANQVVLESALGGNAAELYKIE